MSSQSGPASLPAEDISTNTNGPRQDSLFDDDPEDLFAGKIRGSFSWDVLSFSALQTSA